MSLPLLYLVPEDDDDWRKWAFNHAAIHYTVADNINSTQNQNLTIFELYPIGDLGNYLYWHQTMHQQANAALGTPGNNLLDYDLQDPEQFREFILLNGDEHQRWNQILGV